MINYKQFTQSFQSCAADHLEEHLKIWRFCISEWLKDNLMNWNRFNELKEIICCSVKANV